MIKQRLGKIFLAFLFAWLGTAAAPALAEHELIMTTLEYKIPGTAAVLRGDYIAALEASRRHVDARWYVRRLAARTNLCIAYTGIGDYESAVKWCDAALNINSSSQLFGKNRGANQDSAMQATRASWIAKNNRAVLHLLMGEIGEGHEILEASEGLVRSRFYQAINGNNHQEAEYREALAQNAVVQESMVAKSAR